MVISNYATRQKLANYLEKGILPKDLQDHRKGEYLEDFCLFCGLEHDNIVFTKSSYGGTGLDVHICEECFNVLETKNIGYQKMLNFHTESNRLNNLKAYQKTKTIATDKYSFTKGGENEGKCIFCTEKCIGVPWTLELPVEDNQYYYGGDTSVCDRCYEWLISNNVTLQADAFTDKCPNCEKQYGVSVQVWQIRETLNSLGAHICPHCYYETHKPLSNVVEYINCEVCDISIVHEKTLYVSKNTPTIFKKYCGKCVLASYRREEEIIIKHTINNVYLNIDLHAYEYRILYYSTENKEMQLILEHKCSNSTPPFLMAHQASTMVYKLLEENKIPRQPQQGLLF